MNTNCLAGMACPKCKSEGPFYIEVTHVALVYDDGTDDSDVHHTDWYDKSYCECRECDYHGKVKNFRIKEKGKRK
jgi:hypothetical protein